MLRFVNLKILKGVKGAAEGMIEFAIEKELGHWSKFIFRKMYSDKLDTLQT